MACGTGTGPPYFTICDLRQPKTIGAVTESWPHLRCSAGVGCHAVCQSSFTRAAILCGEIYTAFLACSMGKGCASSPLVVLSSFGPCISLAVGANHTAVAGKGAPSSQHCAFICGHGAGHCSRLGSRATEAPCAFNACHRSGVAEAPDA